MISLVRAIITITLMLLFITLAVWAWSSRRKDLFDRMARMPLEDDSTDDTRIDDHESWHLNIRHHHGAGQHLSRAVADLVDQPGSKVPAQETTTYGTGT